MKKLVSYVSLSTLVLGISSAAFASTDTTDQHHKHYQDQSGTKNYQLISDDTDVPGSYDEQDSDTHSDSNETKDENKDESHDADTTDQDNQNDADKPDDQGEDADSSSSTDDEPTQSDEEY